MLISTQAHFVFIANSKTASTSIEQVLSPHADVVVAGTAQRKHMTLREALAHCAPFTSGADPAQFFKFGVMRDPMDWIGSWFRYRRGNRVDEPLPRHMDFAEFWALQDWNFRRGDGRPHLQGDMFLSGDGRVLADVIIPYHRLEPMLAEICAILGIASALPRKNVSRLKEIGDIPTQLQQGLRDFYAADYALFEQLDKINASGLAALRAGGSFAAP
jgi:hypothetical protein